MNDRIIYDDDVYGFAYSAEKWENFYVDFASNEHAYKADIKKLRAYIDRYGYKDVLKSYEETGRIDPPRLIMLNKKGASKKRTVFSFNEETSWLLKFFGYYLHAYDGMFSDGLYSFRKERSVKTAVAKLLKQKNLFSMFGAKLDIHDYFNSSDTRIILSELKTVLAGQDRLYDLFECILNDPYVYILQENGQSPVKELSPVHKGMMAGSPLSPFLANLYLDRLDKYFDKKPEFYARYSDDMIFFAPTKEEADERMKFTEGFLKENGLSLNPDKVKEIKPEEPFEFLGFSFSKEKVDVSDSSFDKIKKKLKRKARAVLRWRIKKQAEPEKAVKVYIRYFNRKFFENPVKSELTWCRWYFPVITGDATLKKIDHYMQECVRYIYSGRYSKKNYNLRYSEMKSLGYRSLVNEFHKFTELD